MGNSLHDTHIALKLFPPPINVSSSTSTMPPPSRPSLISLLTAFPSCLFSKSLSLAVAFPSLSSSLASRLSLFLSPSLRSRSSCLRAASASRAFWTSSTREGIVGPSEGPATDARGGGIGPGASPQEEEGPVFLPVLLMCLRIEAALSRSRWLALLNDHTWAVLTADEMDAAEMPA